MDINNEITVSYEISSDNESWREIMDNGIDAPEVTGGTIMLPEGGTAISKAAVVGGIFLEGSEAATYAEENTKKLIDSFLPEEIQDHISELLENPESANAIELFLTNIAKNEYMKIAGEFSDNPHEEKATEDVINSIKVSLRINGMPTIQEIIDTASYEFLSILQDELGGDVL